jgi:hypothetical protein
MPAGTTGQGLEVHFLPVSANAAGGDTTVIPADTAVAGERPARKIRIFALVLLAKAATTATLKSAGNVISGPMSFALGSGISCIAEPTAHFLELNRGEAFVINTSADGVYGFVAYTLEPR